MMNKQSNTKARILKAVLTCKEQDMSDEPQLTQIAAKAGISVRTLNRYYPNKEDLVCLAYLRFLQVKYDEIISLFEKMDLSKLNGYEQLLAFFSTSRYLDKDNTDKAVFLSYAYIKCVQYGMKEPRQFKAMTSRGRAVVAKLLEKGQQDHSVKPGLDIETTIDIIETGFNGVMQKMVMADRDNLMEQEKSHVLALYGELGKILECYIRN
ncbi:MAG: TetR/AcrR family transcriptional regulator [Oscillospiraceae bacterium]|nr:TetR/AcrR family transcriptional regulator [Oscillospiraceae bacterium]